jgi:hypothetical protein
MDTWQTPASVANRWLIGLIVRTRPGWRVDHLNVLGVLGAIILTAQGARLPKNALPAAMLAYRGVHGLPHLARELPA